jgi:hypothetical protein
MAAVGCTMLTDDHTLPGGPMPPPMSIGTVVDAVAARTSCACALCAKRHKRCQDESQTE